MNEVEEMLEMIHTVEFAEVMIPLFQQVALCIGSPHFQACPGWCGRGGMWVEGCGVAVW